MNTLHLLSRLGKTTFAVAGLAAGLSLTGCDRGDLPPSLMEDPANASTAPSNGSPSPAELEATREALALDQERLEQQDNELRQREAELAERELAAQRQAQVLEQERALAEREANARKKAEDASRRQAELAARERELEAERAALELERERIAQATKEPDSAMRPEDDTSVATSRNGSTKEEPWTGDQGWRHREGGSDRTTSERSRAAAAGRLRAGMRLEAEIGESLSSRDNQVGDSFRSTLANDVLDEKGDVIVPAGSELIGKVVEARPMRKVGGQAALGLEFHRLVVAADGNHPREEIDIQASFIDLGKNQKRDKGKIAGAAVAGAILGRILGDGETAVVGGIVGAAAGTAAVMKSKGSEVELPAGTTITLELTEVVSSSDRYGPVARRGSS